MQIFRINLDKSLCKYQEKEPKWEYFVLINLENNNILAGVLSLLMRGTYNVDSGYFFYAFDSFF